MCTVCTVCTDVLMYVIFMVTMKNSPQMWLQIEHQYQYIPIITDLLNCVICVLVWSNNIRKLSHFSFYNKSITVMKLSASAEYQSYSVNTRTEELLLSVHSIMASMDVYQAAFSLTVFKMALLIANN